MQPTTTDAVLLTDEKLEPIPYFDEEYEAWHKTQSYLIQGDEDGL